MFIMEAILEKALQEVERDLPGNSSVDSTPVESKWPLVGKVQLDRNFLAGVHNKHLKHSRERLLRKCIAEQNRLIEMLALLLK